jgi:ATP-dependent DNA ligase
VEHSERDGDKMFAAACDRGISKKLISAYYSGPSKSWIKVKNPNAPAATRAADGTF